VPTSTGFPSQSRTGSPKKAVFRVGAKESKEITARMRRWLVHEQPQEDPPWPFKWIWKIDTLPKINIFLWQMCHNALPRESEFVCQLTTTFRGFLLPLHTIYNLLCDIYQLLEESNSILMDHYKTIQQLGDIFSATGEELF